ncbi:MAG: hypothetical protein VX541_12575 [Candidatus Poribacteria bacterium]|nr:hypothetical protein [Candidatus Poribacteria bacterium]
MKTLLLAMKLGIIALVLLFGCQDNNSLVSNMVTESEKSNWDNYRFNNHQVEVAELEALQVQVHELIEKPDDPESENAKKMRHGLEIIQKPDFR